MDASLVLTCSYTSTHPSSGSARIQMYKYRVLCIDINVTTPLDRIADLSPPTQGNLEWGFNDVGQTKLALPGFDRSRSRWLAPWRVVGVYVPAEGRVTGSLHTYVYADPVDLHAQGTRATGVYYQSLEWTVSVTGHHSAQPTRLFLEMTRQTDKWCMHTYTCSYMYFRPMAIGAVLS